MKKLRKLKTGSRNWLSQLLETVISECPNLVECNNCGRVNRQGYVCRYCDNIDPGYNNVYPEDYLIK